MSDIVKLSTKSSCKLTLGPVLVILGLCVHKAYYLSHVVSESPREVFGYIFCVDLLFVFVLFLLSALSAILPFAIFRVIGHITIAALCVIYVIDYSITLALDARLQLSDIPLFLPQAHAILSFIGLNHIIVALLLAAGFFLKLCISKKVLLLSTVLALFLCTGAYFAQRPLHDSLGKYSYSVLHLFDQITFTRQSEELYTQTQIAKYKRRYAKTRKVRLPVPNSNIILVIVEAFSARDSYRTSGLNNFYPRFDRLSKQGVLFENFFANSESSEGGDIALWNGVPALHYPTSRRNLYVEFGIQDSLVASLKRGGYHTEFLTTAPRNFLYRNNYLLAPQAGFALARGLDEVPRFKNAPKFAFDSPSDRVLFNEALRRIRKVPRPFFLTLTTVSNHFPYTDPLQRGNNRENACSYVDMQLQFLFNKLKKRDYFRNGLLIITADHRQMTPVAPAETKHYGASAKARISLAVIGKGIPKGVIDRRFLQQSDLLRKLADIPDPNKPLSPNPIWAERYTMVQGQPGRVGTFEVFEEASKGRIGYWGQFEGPELRWFGRKPDHAKDIEDTIHMQRASHQAARIALKAKKNIRWGIIGPPTRDHGLLMRRFLGTDIEVMDTGSTRFFGDEHISEVNFDSISKASWIPVMKFSIEITGYILAEKTGNYWFSLQPHALSCLAVHGQAVVGCEKEHHRGANEGLIFLKKGLHSMAIRYFHEYGKDALRLSWRKPMLNDWEAISPENFFLPHRE